MWIYVEKEKAIWKTKEEKAIIHNSNDKISYFLKKYIIFIKQKYG